MTNINHPTKEIFQESSLFTNPTAAAWLAALLDGEGTIGVYRMKFDKNRSGYKYKAEISVSNTNIELLNVMQKLVDGAVALDIQPIKRNHKPLYRVRLRASCMRQVLTAVLPYLVIKKQQALYVMAFRKLCEEGQVHTEGVSDLYERIYMECRALNTRGRV